MSHEKRAHALLSPSAADRWMNCPGSLVLGRDLPELPTTEYSREGTIAHELAEVALMKFFNHAPTEAWKHIGKFTHAELDEDQTRDMRFHVGNYVRAVHHIYKTLEDRTGTTPRISFEERVSLSENIWGTKDIGISAAEHLAVVDLKYGRGVERNAKGDMQLAIYGLGTAGTRKTPPKKLHLFIHQPRLQEKPSRWTLDTKEMREVKSNIIAAERRALTIVESNDLSPENFKTGSWCRYCKAQGACSFFRDEIKQEVVSLIPDNFDSATVLPGVKQLSIEDRVKILSKKKQIEDFLAAVEGSLLTRLQMGLPVPGYKLVESSGRRTWKKGDVKKMGAELKKLGVKNPFREAISLVTIGEAKQAVGKKRLAALNKLTELSAGRQHIAREDDGRVEVGIEASFTTFENIQGNTDGKRKGKKGSRKEKRKAV